VVWLVVAATGYGSLVVLIKGAVAADLNAETALALRFTLAALVWWLILLARRQPLWPGARQAAGAAGIGALFYATNALAYYRGTARLAGSLAAMAIAGVPVVVALLAWLFLRERVGPLGRLALAVAGAFHTALMRPADARLAEALAGVPIKSPEIPVVSNVDARPHEDPEEIRDLLVRQVVSPVLWEDSMRYMLDQGVDEFYEVGPGKVLRGLMRRIDRTVHFETVSGS